MSPSDYNDLDKLTMALLKGFNKRQEHNIKGIEKKAHEKRRQHKRTKNFAFLLPL